MNYLANVLGSLNVLQLKAYMVRRREFRTATCLAMLGFQAMEILSLSLKQFKSVVFSPTMWSAMSLIC